MCAPTAMRAVSLEGKSMDEYLRKIKGYVDELVGIGVRVRHEEYVDALLEGLLSDYVLVISVIESKKRTPSIAEIEALLYGHETRLICSPNLLWHLSQTHLSPHSSSGWCGGKKTQTYSLGLTLLHHASLPL